jgi:hypothetical protein
MSNVTAIANLKNLAAYMPDGVRQAADAIMRFLPPDIVSADSCGWYTVAAISTTKAEVTATAGARPLAVIIESKGAAADTFVQFYNNQTGNVTAGTNADMVLPLATTTGELTVAVFFGASWKRFWALGLGISSSSGQETSVAPSVPPNCYILYG